jgi:hypothetical protein
MDLVVTKVQTELTITKVKTRIEPFFYMNKTAVLYTKFTVISPHRFLETIPGPSFIPICASSAFARPFQPILDLCLRFI